VRTGKDKREDPCASREMRLLIGIHSTENSHRRIDRGHSDRAH